MKVIPFYNHYSGEESPSVNMLNADLQELGAEFKEYPCLCNVETKLVLPKIVFVHGERMNNPRLNNRCYDSIKKFMQENPETKFYMFAFSLGEDGVERRIGQQPNCFAIRNGTIDDLLEQFKLDLMDENKR